MKEKLIISGVLYLIVFGTFAQQKDTVLLPSPFDEGYFFVGPDDLLKFKGYAQMDFYTPLSESPGHSEFLIRRARLAATGYLQQNFRYMLYTRFDGGKVQLNEAFLESRHLAFAHLRVGQFKVPFSLSNLTSSSQINFVERPLVVDNLSPAYDIGAMLFGQAFKERIDYAMGIFNGEGRNMNEVNSHKDFIGRLVVAPFKTNFNSLFQQLYFGISGSYGLKDQPYSTNNFETGSGIVFFSRSDTTSILNKRERVGFDMEWIIGSASFRAEYIQRTDNISKDTKKAILTDKGYYIDFTYLLSGEKQQRNSPVKPNRELDPKKGYWGAFELAFRYEVLELSDQNLLAQTNEGTNRTRPLSGGINWYPNDDVRIVLNYERLKFSSLIKVENNNYKQSNFLKFRFQYQF
jgi:phosphate-selective porin OprO/OprP